MGKRKISWKFWNSLRGNNPRNESWGHCTVNVILRPEHSNARRDLQSCFCREAPCLNLCYLTFWSEIAEKILHFEKKRQAPTDRYHCERICQNFISFNNRFTKYLEQFGLLWGMALINDCITILKINVQSFFPVLQKRLTLPSANKFHIFKM